MPLGLTACTEEIYRAFLSSDRTKTFFHGHSYTANPLACAAANASLDLTEKKEFRDALKRIRAKHKAFLKKLSRHKNAENARVKGTILAFEFQSSKNKLQAPSYLHAERNRIYDYFIQNGILLRPLGNTIYLMPPYCITNEELDLAYEKIERFLAI